MATGNSTDHGNTTNDRDAASAEAEPAIGTSARPPTVAGPVPRRGPRYRAGARLADAHGWRATFLGL